MKILQFCFPFLFTKKGIEKSYSSKDDESLTEYEKHLLVTTNKCPDDGGDLLEGAHGGAAINVSCKTCGARFNISPLLGSIKKGEAIPIFADRISDRTIPLPVQSISA